MITQLKRRRRTAGGVLLPGGSDSLREVVQCHRVFWTSNAARGTVGATRTDFDPRRGLRYVWEPWFPVVAAALLALAPGCSCQQPAAQTDGGVGGGAGGGTAQDGGTDAGSGRTAFQLGSGAGRMTGGGVTFDVQLGHPTNQQPSAGNGTTFDPTPAVKP